MSDITRSRRRILQAGSVLGALGALTTLRPFSLGTVRGQPAPVEPEGPTVATRQGRVRGALIDGISIFKGIPYAMPPFGANRFRPPQPVEPWRGVRDALAFGPKSPQLPYPPEVQHLVPPELVGSGEDCLTLNIWSPDLGSARHPVMVWIAGGQYQFHATGASPWYDGGRFARDGVVLVTINYRVGPDGFLYLGDATGNFGLLDQVAALEWVRENIAAFGGDPGNVTVFGESAGALSIGALLGMPRAEGLFRRAILESGGAHQVISVASAQRVGRRLAELLGVAATRAALATVPTDLLLQAQAQLNDELSTQPDPARWGEELVVSTGMPWQPVIDGDVIPARPIDRIAAGVSAAVDVLVGSNANEFNLFLVPGGVIDQITPEALIGTIAMYGLPVEAVLAAYGVEHPGAGPGELFSSVQGDWLFRIPALQLAEAHAPCSGATYMYEFAWRSPQFDGRLGACHAIEIPFVFDTLGENTEASLWGPDPPQSLADAMHTAWVAFASAGDPGWPRYDLDRRATMRFDTTPTVVDDPRAAVRVLWRGVR